MLLRVRDAYTGHRYTTAQAVVDADPERFEVLDDPAVDANGRPLPPDTTPAPAGDEALSATNYEAEEAH